MPDQSRPDTLLRQNALRPLFPLLYAAWADGELDQEEVRRLRDAIEDAPGLAPGCRDAVHDWLDPERPPSAEDLAVLAAEVRRRSRGAPAHGPLDVALRLAGAIDAGTADLLATADRLVGPFEPAAGADLVGSPPLQPMEPLPEPAPAAFSVEELTRMLDGPHTEIKARVRSILSRPELEPVPEDGTAEHRARVADWLRILAGEGVGGLGMPEEVGGGGDPGGFIAAFQVLGHHDLSLLTKFGVQFGLFCGAVLRLGTAHHHRSVLPGAISLEIPGCFAMTELAHGSDVAGLETTATFDRGDLVIHTPSERAQKTYIGNAAADGIQAVVFARLVVGDLDHGVHAFLVPIRSGPGVPADGVTIEDDGRKAGLNGVDNGRVSFDHVRVPRTALLDRFASIDEDGHYESSIASPNRRFFTTLGTLVAGRVSVASAAVGAAETALAIAVRYATRRRQFATVPGSETPLIEYRAHQRRLLPRLAATYAYHFAAADLAARYVAVDTGVGDAGVDRRRLEARAAGLKAHATWHALDVVSEARQACGGQGYMAVNRLGPLMADVDVFTTFEGDNTVLAQLLAKSLLTGYRSSFEDLTPARLVRFVRTWFETVLGEAVPRLGAVSGDLLEVEAQSSLLRRRAGHSLETLARRVKGRIDEGAGAAEAFLDVQPHALHVARARTELWVHRAMAAAVEGVVDTDLAGTLGDLRSLSALWHVEQDLGWFLEHGVLTAAGAGQVRSLVTRLSADLAPHARHLVDAFGIPESVLAAPIAR